MALTRITSSVIKDSTITEGKFDTEYLNATGAPDTGQQPITLESSLDIKVGQGATFFSASNNLLSLNAPAGNLNALLLGLGGLTLSSGNITLADDNTRINSPQIKLNNGTEVAPSIIFGDSLNTGISRVDTPESLVFSVNGSSLLSLTPNTGITLGSNTVKILTTTSTYTDILTYNTIDTSLEIGGTNNLLKIKTGGDDVIHVRSVDTSDAAYPSDENRVGINTNDPQATLDVNGSIRATSYQNVQLTDLPTIPINKGGTGITTAGLPEQLIRVNESGTALEYFTQNTGDVNNLAAFGVSGDDSVYRATGLSVDGQNRVVLTVGDYTENTNSFAQNIGTWRVGQSIKVFGLNTKDITEYDYTTVEGSSKYNQWTSSIDSSSAECTSIGGGGGGVQYTYFARLMNVNTGIISSFHQLKHAGVGANSNVIQNFPLDQFNEQRYNSVVVFRPDPSHTVLIYRFHNNSGSSVTDADGNNIPLSHNNNINLIAILGQRDIGSDINLGPITYKDYGPFNRCTWGELNSDATINSKFLPLKSFPTSVLPATVPTARAIPGFIERQIFSLDYNAKTLILTPTNNATYDEVDTTNNDNIDLAGGGIQLTHDDTSAIHAVMDDVIDKGLDSLYLTGGTYLVTRLTVPPNFSLTGAGKSTIIKKQFFDTSWNKTSGEFSRLYAALWLRKAEDDTGVASNTISQPIENVTIQNLVVDGNYSNSIRLGNSASPQGNALIYADGIKNFSVSTVDIKHSVGDGLWVANGERVSIQNCFISDNSITYRSFDNPLQATDTTILKVSDTAFINNPGPADITTTEVVAFNSCIIRNSGTGLRIYGTKSANTENNLILGPDDEWIPTTDIYDSDYNSVNITCYKTAGSGTNGPVRFTYVEENVAKNFTSTTFESFVYTVSVDANGNETLAATPLTYIIGGLTKSVLDVIPYDVVNGGVQIQIPTIALPSIPYRSVQGTIGLNYNYIIYYINAEEEINIGDTDDYNITGVVSYNQTAQEYTIKVTADTVASFTIGDTVTLMEHVANNGYSVPSDLQVRDIKFANQAWNLKLFKADFNSFLAGQPATAGGLVIDPNATGYIKKKRTYTIAKGIIGVE